LEIDAMDAIAHGNPAVESPKTLYHYCGMSGFEGIVKNKNVWLSNAFFTNDYTEHRLLIDKALERLKTKPDDKYREFDKQLLKSLENRKVPLYLACFSSKRDLLSQWREYSDNAAGFVIAFSYEALNRRIESLRSKTPIFLARVSYEQQEQGMQLDNCLEKYRNKTVACPRNCESNVDDAHICIWFRAAQCKNHGFYEESEYRIILMPNIPTVPEDGISELRFRVTDRGKVPYYAFPFPENAVTEIGLGPKNCARFNRDAHEALRSFLRANGYDVDKIEIYEAEATYQ